MEENRRIAQKKYYEKNKEKILQYSRTYYKNNKQKHQTSVNEYRKNWYKTPIGRASSLLPAYNKADRENGREKGDLTAQWIVENIFSKPCAHCGETDWHKLGCNRIDNDKPHSKDNVEPCCKECNIEYGKIKIYQYLGENLVGVYHNFKELTEKGFNRSSIYRCINGTYKQHKGYKWSDKPL